MADIAFEKDLAVAETGIGGLKVVDLAVHGDSRGKLGLFRSRP